jgi:hypothetical protein
LSWALLPVAAVAENASSWELIVTGSHRELLTRVDLPESGRRCLVWNHSVQGFPVVDCFRVEGNQLILDSSQTPDFAAGLGYTSGRGILKSDNQHGYRIVDMNVLIPNNILRLRVGSQSVNHRIKTDFRTVSLSRLSSNDRVEIRLSAADDKGTKLK